MSLNCNLVNSSSCQSNKNLIQLPVHCCQFSSNSHSWIEKKPFFHFCILQNWGKNVCAAESRQKWVKIESEASMQQIRGRCVHEEWGSNIHNYNIHPSSQWKSAHHEAFWLKYAHQKLSCMRCNISAGTHTNAHELSLFQATRFRTPDTSSSQRGNESETYGRSICMPHISLTHLRVTLSLQLCSPLRGSLRLCVWIMDTH